MSTASIIMMIVTIGGYALGAFFLLNKVFKSQQVKNSPRN